MDTTDLAGMRTATIEVGDLLRLRSTNWEAAVVALHEAGNWVTVLNHAGRTHKVHPDAVYFQDWDPKMITLG